MNLADLKDRVFRNTQQKYQDQEHMRQLINDAIYQMAGEAKLQDVETYGVTAGTANYALPDDYKSPIQLIEGTLDNPYYVYKLIDIASPDYGYAIFNGEIYLKPNPTAEKTLNLYYYKYPVELVEDSDVFEFDERYGNVVAAYASAMILSLPDMGETKGLVDRYFAFWDSGRSDFQKAMSLKIKQPTVRKVENW